MQNRFWFSGFVFEMLMQLNVGCESQINIQKWFWMLQIENSRATIDFGFTVFDFQNYEQKAWSTNSTNAEKFTVEIPTGVIVEILIVSSPSDRGFGDASCKPQ